MKYVSNNANASLFVDDFDVYIEGNILNNQSSLCKYA